MGAKVGRRLSSAQIEGGSMLPGYAGRYYGASAFPQGNVNLGGAPAPSVAPAAAAPSPQMKPTMKPLGHTRPLLAYGVPAAAGLAVGGALAAQGEDPGTAVLGGLAGALGARGGLGAARLAGKYAPFVAESVQDVIAPVGRAVRGAAKDVPAGGKRAAVLGKTRNVLADAYRAAGNISPGLVQKSAVVGAVPAGAAMAGLGGVALGAIPSAMGIPGFQPNVAVDPEAYGSSNSPGARYKAPTMQSPTLYV